MASGVSSYAWARSSGSTKRSRGTSPIAASTRSSTMPRPRSWRSTMCRRAAAKSSGVGWPALAVAVATGSGGTSRGGSAGGGGTGTDGGAAAVEAALRCVRTTRAETGGLDSVTALLTLAERDGRVRGRSGARPGRTRR